MFFWSNIILIAVLQNVVLFAYILTCWCMVLLLCTLLWNTIAHDCCCVKIAACYFVHLLCVDPTHDGHDCLYMHVPRSRMLVCVCVCLHDITQSTSLRSCRVDSQALVCLTTTLAAQARTRRVRTPASSRPASPPCTRARVTPVSPASYLLCRTCS